LPQTLLGELTALYQIPWLDLRGPTSKEKEGKKGKEKGYGEGKWRGDGVDTAWPNLQLSLCNATTADRAQSSLNLTLQSIHISEVN